MPAVYVFLGSGCIPQVLVPTKCTTCLQPWPRAATQKIVGKSGHRYKHESAHGKEKDGKKPTAEKERKARRRHEKKKIDIATTPH